MAKAYEADRTQKREAKAKAAEDKRLANESKAASKMGGGPCGASTTHLDKRTVHLCPTTGSFL